MLITKSYHTISDGLFRSLQQKKKKNVWSSKVVWFLNITEPTNIYFDWTLFAVFTICLNCKAQRREVISPVTTMGCPSCKCKSNCISSQIRYLSWNKVVKKPAYRTFHDLTPSLFVGFLTVSVLKLLILSLFHKSRCSFQIRTRFRNFDLFTKASSGLLFSSSSPLSSSPS